MRQSTGACVKKNERRTVHYDCVAEIMPDVLGLVESHETIARWSLAQICHHLAGSFNGSIDGFDLSNHRIKRWFFRRQLLRATFAGGIPSNYMVDPNLTPPPVVDLTVAVNSLQRAIDRYESHEGSLKAHPLFGNMPRTTWDKLHCVHSAHHMAFVHPRAQTPNAPGD